MQVQAFPLKKSQSSVCSSGTYIVYQISENMEMNTMFWNPRISYKHRWSVFTCLQLDFFFTLRAYPYRDAKLRAWLRIILAENLSFLLFCWATKLISFVKKTILWCECASSACAALRFQCPWSLSEIVVICWKSREKRGGLVHDSFVSKVRPAVYQSVLSFLPTLNCLPCWLRTF